MLLMLGYCARFAIFDWWSRWRLDWRRTGVWSTELQNSYYHIRVAVFFYSKLLLVRLHFDWSTAKNRFLRLINAEQLRTKTLASLHLHRSSAFSSAADEYTHHQREGRGRGRESSETSWLTQAYILRPSRARWAHILLIAAYVRALCESRVYEYYRADYAAMCSSGAAAVFRYKNRAPRNREHWWITVFSWDSVLC